MREPTLTITPPKGSWPCGKHEWRLDGLLHRLDGPALTEPHGNQFWYKNGNRHREDGPACEYNDGSIAWYYEGLLIEMEEDWSFSECFKHFKDQIILMKIQDIQED